MNFNLDDLRIWSKLGQNRLFGLAMDMIASENNKLLVVSADLGRTSGLERLMKNHPARYINVGIAEQNMIGIAAGLADSGYSVFASTLSKFATLRACEFVEHFLNYMHSPVKLVGLNAGFSYDYLSNSHNGLEDIAAIRAFPNNVIISPSDGLEVLNAIDALSKYDGSAYLRLTGSKNNPIVNRKDYEFEIGKAITLKHGEDIAFIACGSMVAHAIEATKILAGNGMNASIINMHTIKPLDTKTLDSLFGNKLIVTIEEHSIVGGLGSAVAEYLCGKNNAPNLLILGVPQGYSYSGSHKYQLTRSGLLPEQIVNSVMCRLSGY